MQLYQNMPKLKCGGKREYNVNMKTCPKCNRELEEKSFFSLGNGRRSNICSRCKYKSRNKDYKLRRGSKRFGYEIADGQFDDLFKKQNGLCAICNSKEKLVVDHDHKTGEVRGLLCNNCNIALGIMKDSPDILRAAFHYLS